MQIQKQIHRLKKVLMEEKMRVKEQGTEQELILDLLAYGGSSELKIAKFPLFCFNKGSHFGSGVDKMAQFQSFK